jgi:hypothetical protein
MRVFRHGEKLWRTRDCSITYGFVSVFLYEENWAVGYIVFAYMYRASFIIFIITNKCTINIIKVYITTVALCNLHSYMFRHFLVIIRAFTTNALLSYILFFKLQLLKIQFIKLRYFTSSLYKFLDCSCWNYNFMKLLKC